jgi:hypothetical protein
VAGDDPPGEVPVTRHAELGDQQRQEYVGPLICLSDSLPVEIHRYRIATA